MVKWGERILVGGRKLIPGEGARTFLAWLDGDRLIDCAELPSGGDNSYPGFVGLGPDRALLSWYSSHETDEQGESITAIYLADLVLNE